MTMPYAAAVPIIGLSEQCSSLCCPAGAPTPLPPAAASKHHAAIALGTCWHACTCDRLLLFVKAPNPTSIPATAAVLLGCVLDFYAGRTQSNPWRWWRGMYETSTSKPRYSNIVCTCLSTMMGISLLQWNWFVQWWEIEYRRWIWQCVTI